MRIIVQRFLSLAIILLDMVYSSITQTEIRNLDTVNGRKSFYQFQFTYDQIINDATAGVRITFPPEIPISLFERADLFQCYFKVSETLHNLVTCSYNVNREVYIQVGIINQGMQSLSIGPIKNPTTIKGTAQFKLCVMYNDYPQSCQDNFGAITFNSYPIAMKSATLNQMSSIVVSQGSSWLFDFELNGTYQSEQYDIRITFPEGFTTNNAGCEILDLQKRPQAEILYNQRQIECKKVQKIIQGYQQVRIINMVNPADQIFLTGFSIQILQSTTHQIQEEIVFSTPYQIQAGKFQVRYQSDNQYKYSNTSYAFYLTPQSLLNENTYIELKFGLEWNLYNQNCSIIRGLIRKKNSQIFCKVDPYLNRYVISNYNSTSYENEILVVIQLETPQFQGNYLVYVNSYSIKNQIIDQGVVQVNVNSTYGSLREFRVHPMQKQIKLKAGEVGPLEFTFFLKTLLPSTNYRSKGKFVVSITPQLNIPNPSTDGLLKCLFYKTIISADCQIVQNGSYTVLTVYTPEGYDFQESEIPITITTEGAKNGRADGFQLDPLVQRYLLNFLTYTQYLPNPMSPLPVEGYFLEWIPDPFEFQDITLDMTTTDSKETTHLIFHITKFPQNVNYWSTLTGRQYLWKITFVNDASGPILQWSFSNTVYGTLKVVEVPCFVYNSISRTKYNIKCELVRRDSNANTFIQITSVDKSLLNLPSTSQDFVIEIPNIQIADVGLGANILKSYLRFSFIEDTPGMINDFVEVYYKDFSFTVTPPYPSSYQYQSMGLFSTNPLVNQLTDLTFSWASASNYLNYVIYEIDQQCFDIGPSGFTVVNEQRQFAKNAQYILVIKDPSITSTFNILDTLKSIKNCFYSNDFQFKVRSFRNNRVIDKYIFMYHVSAADIDVSLTSNYKFELRLNSNSNVEQDINDNIRINEEHQFYLAFRPTTNLIKQSTININIANSNYQFVIPVTNIFYCKVQGLVNSIFGQQVNCNRIDSQNIQITNFDDVNAATTIIEIDFRLKIVATSSPQPLISIETKYVYSATASYLVDFTYAKNPTKNVSPNTLYDTLNKFIIADKQYRYEKRPPNFVGPLYFWFDLINLPTPISLSTITILFPIEFQFQRFGASCNQPLKCIINNVRFICTCSQATGPILVTIYMNQINTFTNQSLPNLNEMVIDTEFVSPTEGFKHPSSTGFYGFDITITDQSSKIIKSTRYIRIRGQKAQYFHVTHVIRDANKDNLFQFTFKLNSLVPVPDYAFGGRVQFELPTIDNKGNRMFDPKLGNNYNTGDYLGCRVYSTPTIATIDSNTKCRIQNSQMDPNVVIIELVSFTAIPVSTQLDVYVTKIKNPSFYNDATNKIMDSNIVLNIQDLNFPTNGNLYYDYFNILMDLRINTFSTYVHDLAKQNAAGGLMPWNGNTSYRVNSITGSLFIDLAGKTNYLLNDYYIIELPISGLDSFQVSSAVCTDPNYTCREFFEINWVIVQFINPVAASSLAPLEIKIVQFPESVSRVDITFNAHIWSGYVYSTQVTHYIYAKQYKQLMGQIKNGSISVLGSADKNIRNKSFVPIRIKLELENKIPSYGAIQIIFNSDTVKLHAHCRSSLTFDSTQPLISSEATIKAGSLGCRIQTGQYLKSAGDVLGDITAIPTNGGKYTSWVISGFQEIPAAVLPALTVIYIEGFVDFKVDLTGTISLSTDDFYAYTYGSALDDPIIQTGRFIDSYYLSMPIPTNTITSLANYDSFNADKYDFLHIEVKPLRGGNRTPLKMVFSLAASATVQAYNGRIRMRFSSANQLQDETVAIGTAFLDMSEPYACSIQQMNDIIKDVYIGCTIISSREINPLTVKERAYEFIFVVNTDLVSSNSYILEFTTSKPVTDGSQEVYGIKFPTEPFTYKIELSMCQACNSLITGFSMWQHHYFQVYGLSFKTEIISYINIPGNWNIFTVSFTAAELIEQDKQRLVVELPTASVKSTTNTLYLFQNDLGLGINNLDSLPCDLLEPRLTTQSITCVLIKGNQKSLQPAKILVSFTNNIVTSTLTRIAFQIMNPTIVNAAQDDLKSFFIPIQVYIETITAKTSRIAQWDIVENTFYIHANNPAAVSTLTDIYYSSGNSDCDSKTDIAIQFQDLALPLKYTDKDAYIIKVNPTLQLIDDELYHLFDATFTASSNPTYIGFLINCKAIIIWPSLAEDIISTKIIQSSSSKIHVPPYTDPNPTNLDLIGYACYVQKRTTTTFNFQKKYPASTPHVVTTTDLDFDVSARDLFNNLLYVSTDRQNYIFTITFNQWQNVGRVGLFFDLKFWKTDLKPDPTSICQEEKNSEIQVISCHLATLPAAYSSQYALLWIDIYKYPTSNVSKKLIFSTSYDSFQPIQSSRDNILGITAPGPNTTGGPLNGIGAPHVNGDYLDPTNFLQPLSIPKEYFTIKLYGWNVVNLPSLNVITGYSNDYVCYFSQFAPTTGLVTTLDTQANIVINSSGSISQPRLIFQTSVQYSDPTQPIPSLQLYNMYVSSYQHNQNIRSWLPYHRYVDEFVGCLSTDKSPIRFEIRLPYAIPAAPAAGPFNQLTVLYGSDITIPDPVKQTDLIINKLICYVNDERVRCTNDKANSKITLEFKSGYAVNSYIFVYVTTGNDMDISNEGVMYKGSSTYFRWQYEISDYANTVKYGGITNYFPIKLRPISVACPYKTIYQMTIGVNCQISRPAYYQPAIVLQFNITLTNVNEINGFRVMFKNYDENFQTLTDDIMFLNIQNGGKYPCYRLKYPDIDCILERDTNSEYTIIHIFNLKTVYATEQIQLLMSQFKGNSPDIYGEVSIQVMGGEKSFSAPTGKDFLGEISAIRMKRNNNNCQSTGSRDSRLNSSNKGLYPQLDSAGVNIYGCGATTPPGGANIGYIYHMSYSNRLDQSQYYLFPSVCYLGSPGSVVLEVLIRDYNEPYDMCEINILSEKEDWTDCSDFEDITNLKCNVSYFIREEGDGATYSKKAFIYIQFISLLTPDYVSMVNLPIGKLKCRQTGKNINGNYRFKANWSCGHPVSLNCCWFNFRQDLVSYMPCYTSATHASCVTSTFTRVTFNPLFTYSDYTANSGSLPGYIASTSILLNHLNNQEGSINIGLKQFFTNYLNPLLPITIKYGYQLAIQVDTSALVGITINRFCKVSGGVGNWDRYFYKNSVSCTIHSSSLIFFVNNFTDLADDYLRLIIQLSNIVQTTPSISFNIYLYEHPIDIAIPLISDSEPILFMQKTIMNEFSTLATTDAPNYSFSPMSITTQTVTPGSPGTVGLDISINLKFPTDLNGCYTKSYTLTIYFAGVDDNTIDAQILNHPTLNCLTKTSVGVARVQYTLSFSFDVSNNPNDQCAQYMQNAATGSGTSLSFLFKQDFYSRKRFYNVYAFVSGSFSDILCSIGSYSWNNYYYNTLESSQNPSSPKAYGLIASTVSLTSLTMTENMISELEVTLDTLHYQIGIQNNIILVIEPTNRSNINVIQPVVDSALYFDKDKINCKCYYFDASNNEIEYTDLMCIRIIDQGSYYFSVHVYIYDILAASITKMHCFIPEYLNAASGTPDIFQIKLIEPGLYTMDSNNRSYQAIAYSRIQLSYIPTGTLYTSTFNPSPPNFISISSSQATNSLVDQYKIDVYTTSLILNEPYIYLRHSLLGPTIDATLCTKVGAWKSNQIRAYSTHSNVIICQSALLNQNNIVIESHTELVSISIPYEYFQRLPATTTTLPNELYVIKSNYNPALQITTHNTVNQSFAKKISDIQLYSPVNMEVSIYNLVDNRGQNNLKLHAMKFEINGGFQQFDRRNNAKITITNNVSQVFGLNCYAESMESSFAENNVIGNPATLRVHVCRVSTSNDIIYIEDEGFNFSNDRKFYVIFSMNVPTTLGSATFTMRYFTKYLISPPDNSFESARGSKTINYLTCSATYTGCISQQYHKTFHFNVKRFMTSYYTFRMFVYQNTVTFDWNQSWRAYYSGQAYTHIAIIRRYGLNGCIRNYSERYYAIQSGSSTYQDLIWVSDYFQPIITHPDQYQELYVRIVSASALGATKTQGSLSVPSTQVIVVNRLTVSTAGAPTLYNTDKSTNVQTQDLKLDKLYYTNTIAGQKTSIFFRFLITITTSTPPFYPSYPATYFEFIYPQLDISNFSLDRYGILKCQVFINDVVVTNANARNQAPRCRVFKVEYQNKLVTVVRVEDVNANVVMTSISFAYDFTLPVPTDLYLGIDTTFDTYVAQSSSTPYYQYQKFQLRIKELILIDTFNTPISTVTSLTGTLNSVSDTTYGQTGVDNIWKMTWNKATQGYDQTNSPGQKVEIRFDDGIVYAQNNNIDTMKFYFNNVLQTPLWFSRADQVIFFSSPTLNIGTQLDLKITADNLWPYQRDSYELNSATGPQFQLIAYTGFPVQLNGNMPRQDFKYQLTQNKFSAYSKRTLEFSLIEISVDSAPDAQQVLSQRATLQIQLQNNLSASSMNTRKVHQIKIEIISGVSSIQKCYFKTPNCNKANIFQSCQIEQTSGGVYSINYRGIRSYDITYNNYIVYAQVVLSAATISYNIYEIVDNPNSNNDEVEGQSLNQSYLLPSYYSTSSNIVLRFINQKHTSQYYEIYQVRNFANRYSTISKLRFRLKLPSIATQAAGNSVQITIPTTIIPVSAYTQFDSTNELQCVFYEEIFPLVSYDVHKLSVCTFSGGVLTFNIPDSDLYSKYYIIEMGERYNPKGFILPTQYTFNEFSIQLTNGGSVYKDTSYQSCPQQFKTFSITHFTTTQNNYDMLTITFVPQTTFAQSNLSTPYESFVLVELESQYFMEDIGLLESGGVYDSDDLPDFLNGRSLSCILRTALSTKVDCKVIVHFGKKIPTSPTYEVEQARIQFVLYEFSTFNPNVQYDLYIPLIKMPSDVNTSIQTRLSFMTIQNGQYITQETSYWINYNKVKADSSTITPFNIGLTVNTVQVTSSSLFFNFDTNTGFISSQNQLMLKWNNNLIGIKGYDIKNLGVGTCTQMIFKTLNLIYITSYPTPTSSVPAKCQINSFQTEYFVQPYGFQFVYINSIVNQETKYKVDSTKLSANLNPTTDISATLVYQTGFVSQYSVSRMILKLKTPQYVPQGSRFEIDLQTNLVAFEERCTILSGLLPISSISNKSEFNQGSLECQKLSSKKYVVSGFQQIIAGPINVQIELFVQTTSSASVTPSIIVTLFTYYKGSYYKVTNYTPINSSVTHQGLGMQYLQLEDKIGVQAYSDDWLRMSYIMNPRNQDLTRNSGKTVTFGLPPVLSGYDLASDTGNILYSKYLQSSTFTYQTLQRNFIEAQCSVQSVAPTKNFISDNKFIPTPYPTTQTFYDINHNQDTIMMIDSNYAAPLNPHSTLQYQFERKAIYIPKPEYYVFHLTTTDTTVIPNTFEEKYYEVFARPREDLDDTFRVTPLTAEVSAKTILILEFTLNKLAVANDEIWIEFLTYDGVRDVFQVDLGLIYSSLNVIQCSYTIGAVFTDPTSVQSCLLDLGTAKQIDKPTRIRIPLPTGANFGDQVRIILPSITNPSNVGQIAGVTVKLMNKCSDHGPLLCIMYHAQHSYFILPASTTTIQRVCSFGPNPLTVSQDYTSTPSSPQHEITAPSPTSSPVTSLPIGTYVAIIYPLNHVQDNPNCVFTQGICIYYNTYNMVLLKITSTFNLSSPFIIKNLQNGIYRWETATQSIMTVLIYQNNIINLLYKCNMQEYDYLYPTIPLTTPAICGTMINTQTVNPAYFLRENYVNVAKIQVYGLYQNRHVNYYRIQKPAKVNNFVSNYCYATLELPNISVTPSTITYIPYDCDVYTSYIIVKKLDSLAYDETNYNFKGAYLTIYLKFVIDNTIPYQDEAASIVLYSCVGQCYDTSNQNDLKDYMHVAQCQINWVISYLKQPNLASAGFFKVPYYLRQAHINQKIEFQMLIRPRTSPLDYKIDKFVFTIPDDFQYSQQLIFDNCSIQGTINLSQSECSLIRRNGYTKLTLVPINYNDNSVKIITLSNKDQQMLFTAPPYPGSYYLMGIEMYSAGQIVETQYMNVTEVIGTTFYQPSNIAFFNIINPLNQLQKEIFHFIFTLNDQILPIGYLRQDSSSTTNIYSNIRIFFEYIGGGWNVHSGYQFDLGTGLPDGAKLGCSSKDLVIQSGNQLTCILNHGTSPENMPNIVISGYESITTLGTSINIYITNLQSLVISELMTIKIGIETIYPDIGASGYLYILTAFIASPTVASSTEIPESMIITVSSNPIVYSTTSYTFTISISATYPNSPTINNQDFIGFQFPRNFIGKYQPIQNTDPNTFVFPESDCIYVRQTTALPLTSITITINNISNPDFQMLTPGVYTVKGVLIDSNHKIKYKMNGDIPNTHLINPFSNISFIQVDAVESISGGDTNVSYKFSFVLGHYVPPNGSISFLFPDNIYNTLKSMYKGCTLSGGQFDEEFNQSYCNVEIDNRLDIILVDTLLSQIDQYIVVVKGITNPNLQSLSSYSFIMLTQYTNQPSLEQVIAKKSFKLPFILYFTPFTCNLSVNSQYRQVSVKSIYTFTFRCNGIIRFKTDLLINLPYQYGLQNNLVNYKCSSPEENTLYYQSCPLQNINGSLLLKIQLKQILTKTQFSINIELNNPSYVNNAYIFTAAFFKDGFQYAESLNSLTLSDIYVNIINGNEIIQALPSQTNIEIRMQNYPLNSGETATYMFMIPQISFTKDVLLTEIFFPTSFSSQLGNNLECSLLQSDQLSLIFDYQYLLYMRTNLTSSQTAIPKYYKVSCKINSDHILSIYGINEYLKDSSVKYNYIFIRNIINPGEDTFKRFKIVHSSQGSMMWVFDDELKFQILDVPDSLDIISVQSSQKTMSNLSTYTFKLNQRTVSNALSTFGLLVQLPDQYNLIQQPNQILCYLASDNTNQSLCQLYREFILIQDRSSKINAIAQQFSVQYLLNPSISDPCDGSNPEIINPYFLFKVIDLTKNIVITTSKTSDSNQCLKFQRDKFSIKLQGPVNFVRGLIYSYNITIEKPANCLSLEPYTDDKYIKFSPSLIMFEQFETATTKQFQIQVKYGAQLGPHLIRFNKEEYTRVSSNQVTQSSEEIYTSPPTALINVEELDERKQMRPQVQVEDFIEFGRTNSQFIVFCKVTKQTSEQFIFDVSFSQSLSNQILIYPVSILITSETQRFNFTVTYLEQKLVQPIKLNFRLNSFNSSSLLYVVNPSYKYLVFSISKIYKPQNILRVQLQSNQPNPSLYKSDIGKVLFDPIKIDNNLLPNSEKVLTPEVLKAVSLEISDSQTKVKVITSFSSLIYYILTLQNSYVPDPIVVRDGIYQQSIQLAYSVLSTNRNVDQDIEYSGNIQLEGLNQDYSYSLFLVCENPFGISKKVYVYNFQTSKVQPGIALKFSLSSSISTSILLSSLSQALRIQSNKIQILTSTTNIQRQVDRNNGYITYEVIIAPNNLSSEKISDYIASYIADSEQFNVMINKFLPGYVNTVDSPVQTHLFTIQAPKFAASPTLVSVGFYDAVINVQMWENSYVYAQVVERSQNYLNKYVNSSISQLNLTTISSKSYASENLISQQIIMGIDQRNQEINTNWLIKVATDQVTKQATIQLDDLKDGATYDIYISATNIMPYNDESLFTKLPNDQIQKITFTTLFNYNTDQCQMLKDVYSMNGTLAQILKRRMDQDPSSTFCYTIVEN